MKAAIIRFDGRTAGKLVVEAHDLDQAIVAGQQRRMLVDRHGLGQLAVLLALLAVAAGFGISQTSLDGRRTLVELLALEEDVWPPLAGEARSSRLRFHEGMKLVLAHSDLGAETRQIDILDALGSALEAVEISHGGASAAVPARSCSSDLSFELDDRQCIESRDFRLEDTEHARRDAGTGNQHGYRG
jgi:hypothetical protein